MVIVPPGNHPKSGDNPELRAGAAAAHAWSASSLSLEIEPRREAARAVVAVLLGTPQSSVHVPHALASGLRGALARQIAADSAPVPAPISYTQAAEFFSASRTSPQPLAPRTAQPLRIARIDGRRKPSRVPVRGRRSAQMEETDPQLKPRTSGRRKRRDSATVARQSIGGLLRGFGEPTHEYTARGAGRLFLWDLRADSSATRTERAQFEPAAAPAAYAHARVSREEDVSSEALTNQVNTVLMVAEENELRVDWLGVEVAISGMNRWENRPGLLTATELITARGLAAFVAREPDRIGRTGLVLETLYDLLQTHNINLYLDRSYGPVRWDEDGIRLALEGALADAEGKKIAKRLRDGVRQNWVETGRGAPGSLRRGFIRNPETRFPEWEPEEWASIIEPIHYGYADARSGRKVGVLALLQQPRARGLDNTEESIRRILRDTIYVDGCYTTKVSGVEVAMKPAAIPLERRIPLQIFQRNQELMALQKGGYSRQHPGHFLGNALPIHHRHCADEQHPHYGRPRIKGRISTTGAERYVHQWAPDCCWRRTFQVEDIERPLIDFCRQAISDPQLISEWMAAQRTGPTTTRARHDPAELRRLQSELRALKNQHAKLQTGWLQRAEQGENVREQEFAFGQSLLDRISQKEAEAEHAANQSKFAVEHDASAGALPEDLQRAAVEILTHDRPADARAKLRRAACVTAIVAGVELEEVDDGIHLHIRGLLMPAGATEAERQANHPLTRLRPLLETYLGEDRDSSFDTPVQAPQYTEVSKLWRDNNWPAPRRFLRLRDDCKDPDASPLWVSPPILRRCEPAPSRPPLSLDDCRAALLEAQKLTPRHTVDEDAYRAFWRDHPQVPSVGEINRLIRPQGFTFAMWRETVRLQMLADGGACPIPRPQGPVYRPRLREGDDKIAEQFLTEIAHGRFMGAVAWQRRLGLTENEWERLHGRLLKVGRIHYSHSAGGFALGVRPQPGGAASDRRR
jgi:DNA invertase Pin-like site-specific DNA recombinase